MKVRAALPWILAAAALGCGSKEDATSKAGYTGTWSRRNDHAVSTVSIIQKGNTALFRWNVKSKDNSWTVTCDWKGKCEEFNNNKKMSDYTFRSWMDPKTGLMMVEVHRQLHLPEEHEVHWTDELVLEDEGKLLVAYTTERDGETFPPRGGPRYELQRVTHDVVDPPSD